MYAHFHVSSISTEPRQRSDPESSSSYNLDKSQHVSTSSHEDRCSRLRTWYLHPSGQCLLRVLRGQCKHLDPQIQKESDLTCLQSSTTFRSQAPVWTMASTTLPEATSTTRTGSASLSILTASCSNHRARPTQSPFRSRPSKMKATT